MKPETALTIYETPPSRRGTRRVLTVRMLAARSGWLDGALYWAAGEAVWVHGADRRAPHAADLALAQRSHYRIRRYPISADLALGDHNAWLTRREQRLELAKRLAALYEPDLFGLARRAQAGDHAALSRLAALLEAEAVCANTLPVSPTVALVACGTRAAPALAALLVAEKLDPAAHALAALALAAVGVTTPPRSAWCVRASAWGRSAGVPADPGLLIRLLADPAGPALARRLFGAQQAAAALALPGALLRTILTASGPPMRVVALAEELVCWPPLLDQVVRRPGGPARRAGRDADAAHLIALAHDAAAVCDARALAALRELLHAQLRLTEHGPIGIHPLTEPARLALTLLGPAAADGLELLVRQHAQIWVVAEFKPNKRRDNLERWVAQATASAAAPLLEQLAQIGDPALLAEAEALGVRLILNKITDRELFRQALAIIQLCDPAPHAPQNPAHIHRSVRQDLANELRQIHNFQSHHALFPLLHTIAGLGPQLYRSELLASLCQELRRTGDLTRDGLTRVARHVRPFARRMRCSHYSYTSVWMVRAALLADRRYPAQAAGWLEWLTEELLRLEQQDAEFDGGSISVATLFAVALSQGDTVRFQAVFRAAFQHTYEQNQTVLEESIERLVMLPGLCAALAQVFSQQPQRCADLLVKIGFAQRLGPGALEPLALLNPAAATGTAFVTGWPEWAEALALAPDLALPAARYCYSQWVLGQEPTVPAGVRQALSGPQKLRRELTYLEALIAQHPERTGLAVRRTNLAARLAAEDALLGAVRAEAHERLTQAAALAQLAAAEELVAACYRRRLVGLAGRLPPELELSADLLNAAQLSIDITQNRRLLRQLVRAHVEQRPEWRAALPANAAFLRALENAGVASSSWLAAWPRRVQVRGLAGGMVRLQLETDPLRILQMGNAFGTCLSLGGINAFSAVANAVDLNKRVLFGYDAAGQVVVRVLVGLTADLTLVRFYSYTARDQVAARPGLVRAVRAYLLAFAARCGLALADDGVVPLLAAEDWYDDGCVSWAEADTEERGLESGRGASAGTHPAYMLSAGSRTIEEGDHGDNQAADVSHEHRYGPGSARAHDRAA